MYWHTVSWCPLLGEIERANETSRIQWPLKQLRVAFFLKLLYHFHKIMFRVVSNKSIGGIVLGPFFCSTDLGVAGARIPSGICFIGIYEVLNGSILLPQGSFVKLCSSVK